MGITALLKPESMKLGITVSTKEEAIDRLVGLMEAGGRLKSAAGYREEILKREALGSTAVGEGIAIPHAKTGAVKEAGLAVITVVPGVDFDSFDGQPARLIFMIGAPAEGGDVHLETLSRLSTLLMRQGFKERLLRAVSKEEFLSIISREEQETFGEKEEKTSGTYRVLAVTACPTGIAHTYMAAERLEQAGEKLGISLKVETNGSGGVKNRLTKEEIRAADAIIVAADKKVDTERFAGKPVIFVAVSKGIRQAEELVKQAVSGSVPIYEPGTGKRQGEKQEKTNDSPGRQIYKHLMNGVSHMLPFVIGGGILIALAFLLDDYAVNPANFGKNTPLAAYLKTIGEQAFGMMLPILAGFIAMSIADRPGLAVGLVAGLIAKMGSTFANPAGGAVNAGFLGALFAGFAGGFLVLGLKRLFSFLPKSLEGIKPVLLYPVFGILLAAVATTFINPYMGFINDGLTGFLNGMGGTSRVLLGLVLGGMMSIDMGGPFNKAAYVFGTAQLAEGNFEVMAAVMAGGMVPPLAIALCTTFFKSKFTPRERQSGAANYVMGLSFITEGAIPFAAQDPLRVLPSCITGSALAGGLSMAFGCTLRAPHGGIFVLPTIGAPFLYLLAITVGACLGCLMLGVLKKPLV